jgi:hypothetical protein
MIDLSENQNEENKLIELFAKFKDRIILDSSFLDSSKGSVSH